MTINSKTVINASQNTPSFKTCDVEDDPPTLGHHLARTLDHAFKANLAQLTAGISPAGLASTCFDWLSHLALSPGKQLELIDKANRKALRLARYAGRAALDPDMAPCIDPLPQDRRFQHPGWQDWPYNLYYQSFLLNQQWWHNATTDIDGLAPESERVVSFIARQLLDRWSPSNLPWLNPEVTQTTLTTGGMNLFRGWQNFVEDWERTAAGKPPVGTEAFQVGKNLAVTPGKVVYRKRTDRADPVRADHAAGLRRTGADRAGLDHEVLHPRSVAAQLAGPVSGRSGPHRVHDLVEESRSPSDRDLGMDDYRRLGPDGRARCDRRPSSPIERSTPSATAWAAPCCRSPPLRWPATDDERLASLTTVRHADRFHRGRRADAVHRREPGRRISRT